MFGFRLKLLSSSSRCSRLSAICTGTSGITLLVDQCSIFCQKVENINETEFREKVLREGVSQTVVVQEKLLGNPLAMRNRHPGRGRK